MVAEWAEYERWFEVKRRKLKVGTITIVAAFVVAIAVRGIAREHEDLAFVSGLLSLASTIAEVSASIQIVDAKGQSRWWWVIGILTLLLPDQNKRDIPQKPGSGVIPAGSALSDW